MKLQEFRKLIREEIQKVLTEENDESIDLSKPYAVIVKGGSIGGSRENYLPQYGGTIVATFDTVEDAKKYASGRRKMLSPGDRSYYKMTYNVVKNTKKV